MHWHLSVSFSWQQYLNDANNNRINTDPKQQLGSYFAQEVRRCPSDLDIHPVPVASTLSRHEPETEGSQQRVPDDEILGDRSNNSSGELRPYPQLYRGMVSSVQDLTPRNNDNGSSFGYAMTQAVHVLNSDQETEERYNRHVLQASYASETNSSIGSDMIDANATEPADCAPDSAMTSLSDTYCSQENLPLKKRTDRIYQDYGEIPVETIRHGKDSAETMFNDSQAEEMDNKSASDYKGHLGCEKQPLNLKEEDNWSVNHEVLAVKNEENEAPSTSRGGDCKPDPEVQNSSEEIGQTGFPETTNSLPGITCFKRRLIENDKRSKRLCWTWINSFSLCNWMNWWGQLLFFITNGIYI